MLDSFFELGFSESEAKVYMCLLSLGQALPSVLAKKSGLKRAHVYQILEKLCDRGLILKLKKQNYSYFAIDDLDKLRIIQKQKLNVAETLVKALRSNLPNFEGWGIRYYQGEVGLKELYDDILIVSPEELLGWVDLDKFYSVFDPEVDRKWTKERVRNGTPARLILNKSIMAENFSKKDTKNLRECRFFSEQTSIDAAVFLYDGRVIFLSPGSDMVGISIQHSQIYQTQKAIFESNWSQLN